MSDDELILKRLQRIDSKLEQLDEIKMDIRDIKTRLELIEHANGQKRGKHTLA